MSMNLDVSVKDLLGTNLASETNRVSIESQRTGELLGAILTRVTLLDIIPQEPTMDRVVKYDEETLNESAVAAIAEGAVYAESAFQYDEKSVNVSKMGSYINVSGESLDDLPELRARIDRGLRNQVLRRIQSDIIGGAPIPASEYVGAPADNANITGLLNIADTDLNVIDGNLNAATGTFRNPITVVEEAIEMIYRIGDADADAVLMNSQDWIQVSTLETTTGAFVARGALAGIAEPTPRVIAGLPVVFCNALPANTVFVGAFRDHAAIRDRQSIEVRIQESQHAPAAGGNTQPTGRFNIYADARLAFFARRPLAFAKIIDYGVPAA